MAIGMTPSEYWWGDNDLPKYYIKAKRLKDQEKNQWLWLQGAYIYEAICDVSPVLRAFSKATKPEPYTQEPYGLFADKEVKQNKEQAKYERMKAFMKAKATNGGKC